MSDHTIISLDNYRDEEAWWDAFLRRVVQRHRDPAYIAEARRNNQQRADSLGSVDIASGFALVEFGPHRVWAYVFSLEFSGSTETHAFLEMEDPANPTQDFDVFALTQTLWPNNVRHAKVLPLQPLHAKELLAEEYPGVAPLLTELDPVAAVRILDRAHRSGLAPDDEIGLRRVVRDAIEQRQRIRRCFPYCLDLWDEAPIREDQP